MIGQVAVSPRWQRAGAEGLEWLVRAAICARFRSRSMEKKTADGADRRRQQTHRFAGANQSCAIPGLRAVSDSQASARGTLGAFNGCAAKSVDPDFVGLVQFGTQGRSRATCHHQTVDEIYFQWRASANTCGRSFGIPDQVDRPPKNFAGGTPGPRFLARHERQTVSAGEDYVPGLAGTAGAAKVSRLWFEGRPSFRRNDPNCISTLAGDGLFKA